MTTEVCTRCTEGPSGESGHETLEWHTEGPFPGHHIFRCTACDERWIRHYGSPDDRFAWTRYGKVFAVRKPIAGAPTRKVTS